MEFREIQEKGLERAAGAARCCYIKPSGERCGSPAMRGIDLCYYHDRYQPKPGYRNLPCLEDPHSVQCAIQEVIEDMLNGLLDYKKAALALYGLQTAASNLKQMRIAEEKKLSMQRSARSEEEACPVAGAQCAEVSRTATDGFSPARRAGNSFPTNDQSRRDDWNSAFDEVEEIELAAGSRQPGTGHGAPGTPSLPPTSNQPPTTPFVESPRQPQHVTFGLTPSERKEMKQRFPDMKAIREEYLSMLTPEERAMVDENALGLTTSQESAAG